MREQSIRGDVEGYPKKDVGAALVELAGELTVGNVKLEERMTGRQRHIIDTGGVVSHYDMAAAVWIFLNLPEDFCGLIRGRSIRVGPRAALIAVYWPQVSF